MGDEATGAQAEDPQRSHEERALLRLVATGGRATDAAMRTLFTRYQTAFKAHLRSRGFRDADIDDVTQRVWLDISRKAGEFSGDGPPGAWLWGFLRNAKNDLLRANAQRGDRFVSANDERHTQSIEQAEQELVAQSPEAQRHTSDFRDCVQRAFAEFKRQHPEEAWWMYLRHFEGWDLDQIAAYRGSTLHAAVQFISKARKGFGGIVAHCRELMVE